jgi:hypothetical protein
MKTTIETEQINIAHYKKLNSYVKCFWDNQHCNNNNNFNNNNNNNNNKHKTDCTKSVKKQMRMNMYMKIMNKWINLTERPSENIRLRLSQVIFCFKLYILSKWVRAHARVCVYCNKIPLLITPHNHYASTPCLFYKRAIYPSAAHYFKYYTICHLRIIF